MTYAMIDYGHNQMIIPNPATHRVCVFTKSTELHSDTWCYASDECSVWVKSDSGGSTAAYYVCVVSDMYMVIFEPRKETT